MLLVTGGEGLIGRHVSAVLRRDGYELRSFDLKNTPCEDVIDTAYLDECLDGVEGIIHLAAVSRVVWGERDPVRCWRVNVDAFAGLLDCISRRKRRPWIILASSREVYGDARRLPVREDDPSQPLNVYARSKCEGERLARAARADGIRINICRFSSVYGCPLDHPDRVVPAFAYAAATNGVLRVEGSNHTFDFTHVDDVAHGLAALASATDAGELLPPIHFASGNGVTLRQLAEMVSSLRGRAASIVEAPSRHYDASRFVGDTGRAEALLGWRARTPLRTGVERLVSNFEVRLSSQVSKPRANRSAALARCP